MVTGNKQVETRIAPAVGARNKDMAYAIAVVLMFGLLALLLFIN